MGVLVLVALFVTLIPTSDRRCCSAIGIAGMDRWCAFNVLAMSGRAVEAAGDVRHAAARQRPATITSGNRQATSSCR
jgi:K+-transporting ATPase ATPase B chain